MLFSEQDIVALRLLYWCQYIQEADLKKVIHDTELQNLVRIGMIKFHVKSKAFILTGDGRNLLHTISKSLPDTVLSYHPHIYQRRIRSSKLLLTMYQAFADFFTADLRNLTKNPSLFLPFLSRGKGRNPWGSTRIIAIAHLGDLFCAVHYVCSNIGKVALTDELTAFTNHTARFPNAKRAFLFAGECYQDILSELDADIQTGAKLISYGGAYRCLLLPVYLLSCDDTGAVQLQIMAVPDYRRKLTQAALKAQYQPPPKDVPAWDALFQGMPFVLAADMDLRRLDAALEAAHERGMPQIAMAALEGQAEAVLFSRYRDTGLAKVFVLTGEAISEVTGQPAVPYTPPRTQFTTPKGDVVDVPLIQAGGRNIWPVVVPP